MKTFQKKTAIKQLTVISIPRSYHLENYTQLQLHVFCDSTTLAYGAVAYLRKTSTATTSTVFLTAKSKAAPIKKQSLPRLELLAALLGARLCKFLTKTLQKKLNEIKVIMWSDSRIVLSW